EQILNAQRATRDLVFVGGTDAAAGGADARLAQRDLARLIESDVVGHDQRACRRNRQPGSNFDAGSFQLADLLQQRGRRDDDAVAEVHAHGGPQNAGGDQAQDGLLTADDERVAGVMAALKADDALRVLGQPVDDLALAFIAPLRADDDDVLAHARAWSLQNCRATCAASCRRSSVNPVAGRARPNALPMPS